MKDNMAFLEFGNKKIYFEEFFRSSVDFLK